MTIPAPTPVLDKETKDMPSVSDVAAFICAQKPAGLTTMKLQKLVYYSQVWSLLWDGAPLFPEATKAYDDGPVVPELWHKIKSVGVRNPGAIGNQEALSEEQKATILGVLDFYGQFSGDELSQLTHREAPWRDTRAEAPGARNAPISHERMAAFYKQAAITGEKRIPLELQRGLRILMNASEEEALLLTQPDPGPSYTLEEWEELQRQEEAIGSDRCNHGSI